MPVPHEGAGGDVERRGHQGRVRDLKVDAVESENGLVRARYVGTVPLEQKAVA